MTPRFRQWWAAHDVAARDTGVKHLRHPIAGDLYLDWNAMTWEADPQLQIIVWSAEPGSPTHDNLLLLAAWASPESHASPASQASQAAQNS